MVVVMQAGSIELLDRALHEGLPDIKARKVIFPRESNSPSAPSLRAVFGEQRGDDCFTSLPAEAGRFFPRGLSFLLRSRFADLGLPARGRPPIGLTSAPQT